MALFVNANSELPDITSQNSTKNYQNGHKSEYFSEKMTSGNSDVKFEVGLRGILMCLTISNSA